MPGPWPVFAAAVVLIASAGAIFALYGASKRSLALIIGAAAAWAAVVVAGLASGSVPSTGAAVLYFAGGALVIVALDRLVVSAGGVSPVRVTSILLWLLLVLLPLGLSLFAAPVALPLVAPGVRDYGGALAVLVPLAGLLVVLRVRTGARQVLSHPGARRLLLLTAIAWCACLAWLVGVELRIDAVIPRVVIAGVLTPLAAALGWSIAAQLRRAGKSSAGTACAGAVAGMAAVLPAAPHLDVLWAIVLGGLAGSVSGAVAFPASTRHRGGIRLSLALAPIPASIGVIYLGLFGAPDALVYTGSLDALVRQTAAVAGVVAWSLVAAIVALLPLLLTSKARTRLRR